MNHPNRLRTSQRLTFYGHEVFEAKSKPLQSHGGSRQQQRGEEGEGEEEEADSLSAPRTVEGNLMIRSAHQVTASTDGQ